MNLSNSKINFQERQESNLGPMVEKQEYCLFAMQPPKRTDSLLDFVHLVSLHEFEFRQDDVLAPDAVDVLQRDLQRRRVLQKVNLKNRPRNWFKNLF